MNEPDKFELVPRLPGALEKAELGAKRVLADMVQEALALARAKVQAQSIPALPSYPSSDVEAWYQKAASYFQGKGVPKDYAEALKWYRKAADQGHALAQNGVGVCYERGCGVLKDYAEAVKWFRKAAELGEAYKSPACWTNLQRREKSCWKMKVPNWKRKPAALPTKSRN
jgi:TPR repeat protein